jgi:hypothetical protein
MVTASAWKALTKSLVIFNFFLFFLALSNYADPMTN